MLNGSGVSRWRVAGFARFLWRRFNEVDVLQAAGSLTFTTLLALVPILTVLLVVVTVFPLFGGTVDAFMLFLNRTIVPSGVSAVVDYLNEFKLQAGRLTTLGVGLMAVTVLMMVNTVEQTFNQIWRVRQRRGGLVPVGLGRRRGARRYRTRAAFRCSLRGRAAGKGRSRCIRRPARCA